MKITKEELAKMIEAAEDVDAGAMVALAHEFLEEVNHKRPVDVMTANAGGVAYLLMRDRALYDPVLTKATTGSPKIPGVPEKLAIDFTLGMMLGIYLANKGEARWQTTTPTKPTG